MVSAFTASFSVLSLAITAPVLFSFLDPQSGGGTTTPAQAASLLHGADEVLPPLAAAGALFLAVTFIHHHLMSHAGGPGNRRLSGLVVFVLCVSAGMLELNLVPLPPQAAGGADHGAQALRALGSAALRALPAASTAAFFLGMALIFTAHVRAGGEGGGGAAVAGDGPIQGPVRVLTNVALGAASALVFLMLVAVCGAAAKY